MNISDLIENVGLENKSSDYAQGVTGRFWWNTSTGQIKTDDGTNIRALIRNDGSAIFGNSGTAANNIRLHRGASGVLQFVSGADSTSEGSLSTSLNQISGRLENYSNSGKPSTGNAGRVIWTTDLARMQVDTGTAWVQISPGTTALWDFIVGSSAQVSAGVASHTSLTAAIAAASAGNTIKVLEGTFTESPTVNLQLYIEGAGYGSFISGTITFATSSDRSHMSNMRTSSTVVINSGVQLVKCDGIWLASGQTFTDNGTGSFVEGFQET